MATPVRLVLPLFTLLGLLISSTAGASSTTVCSDATASVTYSVSHVSSGPQRLPDDTWTIGERTFSAHTAIWQFEERTILERSDELIAVPTTTVYSIRAVVTDTDGIELYSGYLICNEETGALQPAHP